MFIKQVPAQATTFATGDAEADKRAIVRRVVDCITHYDINSDELLNQLHIAIIEDVLHKCNGNKRKTADFLGIGRTTLIERMRKYGFALNKRRIQVPCDPHVPV